MYLNMNFIFLLIGINNLTTVNVSMTCLKKVFLLKNKRENILARCFNYEKFINLEHQFYRRLCLVCIYIIRIINSLIMISNLKIWCMRSLFTGVFDITELTNWALQLIMFDNASTCLLAVSVFTELTKLYNQIFNIYDSQLAQREM